MQHHCEHHALNRRHFITGLGAAAAFAGDAARASTPHLRFIDVHHHFQPTGKNNDGNEWSIQTDLDELDRNGISSAIGWSGPITTDDIDAGRKQARDWNEWGARIGTDHPGRYGLFASLPLRDVDGSLAEIAYAFEVLKADGIGLATNYGNQWLGDAQFQPIWQELNRRRAAVYVHPTGAPCCTPSTLSYETGLVGTAWLEFPMNTARTILSLLTSGTTQRFPDIKFIFSHGGGAMPILIGRIAGFDDWRTVGAAGLANLFPDGIYAEYKKLYFECAQAYAPEAMDLVRKLAAPSHVLFGSDYSYFPISHSVRLFNDLKLPRDVAAGIASENAAALFPRWKA